MSADADSIPVRATGRQSLFVPAGQRSYYGFHSSSARTLVLSTLLLALVTPWSRSRSTSIGRLRSSEAVRFDSAAMRAI
jgi:hypothetical protein